MAVEIISHSISAKVSDQARIELATPGSAVRHISTVRHVTDCTMQPILFDQWAFTRGDLQKFGKRVNDNQNLFSFCGGRKMIIWDGQIEILEQ